MRGFQAERLSWLGLSTLNQKVNYNYYRVDSVCIASKMPIPAIVAASSVEAASGADSVVLVFSKKDAVAAVPFGKEAAAIIAVDPSVAAGAATCHVLAAAPGSRLVLAGAGAISRDQDDVRRLADAVDKGIKRAKAAGSVQPLLIISSEFTTAFPHALEVAAIAAAGACYAPRSIRLVKGEAAVEPIGRIYLHVVGAVEAAVTAAARVAGAVEAGKRIARDIAGGDPEAMSPINCAAYIVEAFKGMPGVTVSVIDDQEEIKTRFPLGAAVARASMPVPRHHPRVVRLEYTPAEVKKQVFLVGKGVCYDTGGADVKTGGAMVGMSRDKGGAAAAAGFVATCSLLATPALRVVAWLGFYRNSIGSDSYVADEIITTAAGKRMLVVNTDAEGRFVMTDLLYAAKNEITSTPAAARPPTVLHTVATLTGHAVIAVGPGYSIAVDNGAAKKAGVARTLQEAGERYADPVEISSLRREDFDFVAAKTAEYDVRQGNNLPSVSTPRGHIFPMAAMIVGSGLDAHGIDSADPIAYCHLDIAGSSVAPPFIDGVCTGAPVAALAAAYIL